MNTTINNNILNEDDTVIYEKSVFSQKTHTDDMVQWSIVHFETDEEDDIEGFNDLIPSAWITTSGTLCRYPMYEHQARVHKMVKRCVKPNNIEWDCFSIRKIEEGIGNYDQGMKMLVKISKNPNATFNSDIEEKGKGRRMKKPVKHFDDSDKENNLRKQQHVQSMLPPFPKLTTVSNWAGENPLPSKVDKIKKKSCLHKASTSFDNSVQQQISVVHDRNLLKDSSIEMSKSKSAVTLESLRDAIFHLNDKASTSFNNTVQQQISVVHDRNLLKDSSSIEMSKSKSAVTLESLRDEIWHLNAEVLSCKLILRKIDRNIESFLETETMEKQYASKNKSSTTQVLEQFPLTNVDDLNKMEHKLKNDQTFYWNVIDALHAGTIGQSLQRKINFVLCMLLHDKLASLFNWKGQRGTKLTLSKHLIAKIMIEAVAKEFPHINQTMFGRKAGPWLAQVTFRIKKQSSSKEAEEAEKTEEAAHNNRMISNHGDDSNNNESSDKDSNVQ